MNDSYELKGYPLRLWQFSLKEPVTKDLLYSGLPSVSQDNPFRIFGFERAPKSEPAPGNQIRREDSDNFCRVDSYGVGNKSDFWSFIKNIQCFGSPPRSKPINSDEVTKGPDSGRFLDDNKNSLENKRRKNPGNK